MIIYVVGLQRHLTEISSNLSKESGGGRDALARRMKHRKIKRRLEVKRFVRDLNLKSKRDS